MDSNGEPVSAAHKAIYDYIGSCRDGVIDHQQRIIEEFEARHVTERHHEPMSTYLSRVDLTPQDLVRSAVEMHEIVPGLADFVYGPPLRDPASGRELVDGNGRPLRDEKRGAVHAVRNGGFRARLSRSMVALLVAIIGAIATLSAAVIQSQSAHEDLVEQVVQQVTELQREIESGA